MDRSRSTGSKRYGRGWYAFAPVLWIAVLLGSWLIIVEWKMLPDLVSATMAALP
jgi:hypothetical protein